MSTEAPDTAALQKGVEDWRLTLKGDKPLHGRAKEIALKLITDPEYLAELQIRLKAGLAGPIEPYLWKLGLGDWTVHHPKATAADDERFEKIREEAKRILHNDPEKAREVDLAIASSAGLPITLTPETKDG